MSRRGVSAVLCGFVAFALVGCSSSTAKKAGSTTSTSRTATTRAGATTPVVTIGNTATTPTTPVQNSVAAATTTPTTTRATTPTTAAGRVVSKPNDNVQLGDSGAGVRQIQNALIAKGYKITVDGSFGSQTDNAVKDFQTKNSLKADGIVGPATWAKLSSTTNTATTTTTTKR